jgi:hypothetical protein
LDNHPYLNLPTLVDDYKQMEEKKKNLAENWRDEMRKKVIFRP